MVPTLNSRDTIRLFSNKVLYFPPLYTENTFTNMSLSDKKLKILFIAKVSHWQKNFQMLVNALNKIHEMNVDFVLTVVGKSTNNKDFSNVKFKNKLNYLGFKKYEELKDIYLSSNLFVLPSLMDPIGAVIQEAMAHSLPVIASSNVGASDCIENNKNGFVFNSDDVNDLTKKILFFQNSSHRVKFGSKSKKILEKKYWLKNARLIKERKITFLNFLQN